MPVLAELAHAFNTILKVFSPLSKYIMLILLRYVRITTQAALTETNAALILLAGNARNWAVDRRPKCGQEKNAAASDRVGGIMVPPVAGMQGCAGLFLALREGKTLFLDYYPPGPSRAETSLFIPASLHHSVAFGPGSSAR